MHGHLKIKYYFSYIFLLIRSITREEQLQEQTYTCILSLLDRASSW